MLYTFYHHSALIELNAKILKVQKINLIPQYQGKSKTNYMHDSQLIKMTISEAKFMTHEKIPVTNYLLFYIETSM